MNNADVIKGLRCCINLDRDGYPNCERCPYSIEMVRSTYACTDVRELMRDALKLLEEQEPTAADEPAKRCGSCK